MADVTLGALAPSTAAYAEAYARSEDPAGVRDTVVVLVAAIVVALLSGMSYGVENQNTYMLAPLRHLDPSFLRNDWLAAHTYAYHPAFIWVVTALAALGPVPVMTAVLNAILVPLFALVLLRLLRVIAPKAARDATLFVLLLVVVDRTMSVGQSYIFGGYLQPSVMASVAFVAAMSGFLRGRWGWSGAWLAVAGILHANFLVVGLLIFGVAHLLLGRERLVQRWAFQLVPAMIVFAVDLPVLLRMGAGGADAQRALYIFQVIRSPHHYVVRHFLRELVPFLGWLMIAPLALRRSGLAGATSRRIVALEAALAGAVLFATAAGLVTVSSRVTQLYLWRVAPFAVLLIEIVAGIAVSRTLRREQAVAKTDGEGVLRLIGVAGSVLVLGYAFVGSVGRSDQLAPALALIVAVSVVAVGVWRRWPVSSAIAAAFTLVALAACVNVTHRWNIIVPDESPAERSLFQWAAATPGDAVFLVPPGMDRFRLGTARAIVVDWKSTPILPSELLQWYDRISDEVGGAAQSLGAAERGYAGMSAGRARELGERYGARYAVFRNRPDSPDRGALPVAYRNARYTVYELAPTRARATQ